MVGVAAGIARESRPELGAESLAKQQGFRTPATLIAATTGRSTGDAARLVKVGEATAPRADLLGAPLPARYPLVRDALDSGVLGAPAAAMIIAVLDRCRVTAGQGRISEGSGCWSRRRRDSRWMMCESSWCGRRRGWTPRGWSRKKRSGGGSGC